MKLSKEKINSMAQKFSDNYQCSNYDHHNPTVDEVKAFILDIILEASPVRNLNIPEEFYGEYNAMEFGYKQCEKGSNFLMAREDFLRLVSRKQK